MELSEVDKTMWIQIEMNVFPDIHKTEIVLSTRWGCMKLMLESTLCHTTQFSGNGIYINLAFQILYISNDVSVFFFTLRFQTKLNNLINDSPLSHN